jgi:hypothetical protein
VAKQIEALRKAESEHRAALDEWRRHRAGD